MVTHGGHGETVRVAIVTESFLPATNGVTTSVLRVLDHLAARGHQAMVVCPGPAPAHYAGFPVREVTSFTFQGFRAAVPSPLLARHLDEFRPDVVHAAAPFALGYQALLLARRRAVPTVAIFQTDIARFALKYGLVGTEWASWRWVRTVHDQADLTLAPSSAALHDLHTNGVARTRTALWGRGVDAVTYHPRHRATPAGQALREELLRGAPAGTALVGYVGRLAPEKRVERLAALDGLGVRLAIVGDGPSRSALERKLKNAVFLGKRTGEELARCYAALDVFVHTGIHETFGQTLQEAMASGVPVVAPAAGGPLDVVAPGETGYLYGPEDDADLRSAVAALSAPDAAARRAQMGEAGRRRVLPRSWEALGDTLLEHYAAVADATPVLSR